MLHRPAAGSAPHAGCWPHASPFLQGGREGGGRVGGGAWLGCVSSAGFHSHPTTRADFTHLPELLVYYDLQTNDDFLPSL